jgi:hypothetical protein
MMNAHCFELGVLTLGTKSHNVGGVDHSGAVAAYNFSSYVSMHFHASGYEKVIRPNGKSTKGCFYTLKMAENDWRRYGLPSLNK